MFDFIKKLLKKPRKTPSKSTNRPVATPKPHSSQPVHKPECCCKKEEKAPECVMDCSSEVKNTETVIETVEVKTVSANAEAVVEVHPVEASSEIEEKMPNEPEKTSAYVIRLAEEGIYNFELVSPEGKTIIKSGDYTLKRSCVSGIQSVKKNGITENVEDRTVENPVKAPNPKYEIALDESSKYHFSLKAPNGYVILTSPAYNSKRACTSAIRSVRANSQTENIEDTTK